MSMVSFSRINWQLETLQKLFAFILSVLLYYIPIQYIYKHLLFVFKKSI